MDKIAKKNSSLVAGAAVSNITPLEPHFLYGYPFVERISEGVNDWLLSSALYLTDGNNQVLVISNDVIYVSKASVSRIRKEVSEKTGIPGTNIMVSATHTHSGPVTADHVSSSNDPVVPRTDNKYVRYMEDKIIEAACNAFHNASPAEAGFTVADGTGAGTNRHNPSGPADLEIPVVIIRNPDKHIIACMLVCNMHPTVLHEDSKLYSGDFPAFLRETLQKKYFNCECPVLYFTGAAGNQSPRHVTQSNTFEEARRIGGLIANAVALKIIKGIEYSSEISVLSLQKFVDLPRRKFSDPESAKEQRDKSFERFEHLKRTSANKQEIRTAEVNWFGAEESLHFATLAQSQDFEDIYKTCLPAEIQIIKIGKWNFAAWPGEVYIEYEIELKKKLKDTFLITLANGELQGYIATEEAEKNGYYEALNSFFHYTAGSVLVEETIRLIKSLE